MPKPHLLIPTPLLPMVEAQLEPLFTLHRLYQAADRNAVLAEVGPQVVAAAWHYGDLKCDGALLDRLAKLRIIANFGVGYDSIDAVEAGRRGIVVTNTPDVLTEETADTALGLLLMTVRELSKAEAHLRTGRWDGEGPYRLTPNSLRDRSVGIAGLGRIGHAIARRCVAFGLPISYFGRRRQAGVAWPYFADLTALAHSVDTLIVAIPATPATAGLVSAGVLEALGPRGILINIARGSVVDEPALILALQEHRIAAAGLDVMVNEPRIDARLLALDNSVLLPHVGSASQHTRGKMGQLVVDNLAAFAAGRPPLTPVVETPFAGW